MNVVIGFENSGIVRDAFIARGFNAVSVDILPSRRPGPHVQCDMRAFFSPFSASYYKDKGLDDFDLAILHPDCTYLCSSGLHWNKRRPERAQKTLQALEMINWCWSLPIPHLVIENPQGCINTRLPGMPTPQYIQPFEFGHNASKKTGLWRRGLPPLKPTCRIAGRWVLNKEKTGYVERFENQTDSGQNRLGPSNTRDLDRAQTYPGIADAMAWQWGDYVKNCIN